MAENSETTRHDGVIRNDHLEGGGEQDRCNRYWVLAGLLTIILFAGAIRIRVLDVPLERDEGEYAYAGQLILQGIMPYQAPSLYKYKMPAIYFLYALIIRLFGQTPTGVHCGLLVANIATLILLYLLGAKVVDRLVGVAAAAFYSMLSLVPGVLGMFAHAEHFVVLAALGGILLLLSAKDSLCWWKLLLSGILFALAYLIRQHGAAFALFAFFYLLVNLLRASATNRPRRFLSFAVFCAGIAIPFVLVCIVLLAAGVFGKFWFWTVVYASKYLSIVPLRGGLPFFKVTIVPIMQSAPLIWLLAAGGLVVSVFAKGIRAKGLFLWAFVVFSFISVCPGLYFRHHYFVLLLPAVSLLAGIALWFAADILVRSRFIARPTPAVLYLLFVIVFGTAHHQRDFFFNLSPREIARKVYGGNPFPESLEIARYIKENSSPNDSVAVLGSEPQIFFYAKRHSATGYTDTYEMMRSGDYALQMQKEMIAEIERACPKFLVFVHVITSWSATSDSPELIFGWLSDYSAKYYKQVGIVDIISGRQTNYIWGDDAASYKPRSEYWLSIFRRKD
jgi:hypothetical protein